MHINHIDIREFRVLENLIINFKISTQDENVINVLAGVNGSGKTSVLEVIKKIFTSSSIESYQASMLFNDQYKIRGRYIRSVPSIKTKNNSELPSSTLNGYIERLTQDAITKGNYSSPKLINSPAKLAFEYKQVVTLDTKYRFYNEINTRSLLGNAEFFIRDYVISKERLNRSTEPKERTRQAVEQFNAHFSTVEMPTLLFDLDVHQQNRPIFKNSKGDLITIEQLSDGEKQLYGRVVSLMILNPVNSIILIDEPEISLHPTWQISIMDIYMQIGKGNQFIIATHSPQIVANTPYENLILLNKNQDTGKIQVTQLSNPPSGTDVNSILSEVMGADSIPESQIKLYRKYRTLVESKKEKSEEAETILNEILKRENSNSEFLQEMNFLIELRNV